MSKKHVSTVLGAAVATTLAGAAGAGENPFAMKELASGYVQVAEAGKDTKEMVCGEGKCGGKKMQSPEMNCGAMKEQAKKSQAPETKAMEGKCAGMNMGTPPAAPAAPTPAK
jgi:uncharacterized low-complexity protein